MHKRILLLLVTLCISAFLFSGVAAAQGFSADVIWRMDKQTSQGKIFVGKDKVRLEVAGMTTISRMDKKVVWMLMPEEKMYMEQGIRFQNTIVSSEPAPGEVERTLLGTETINGIVTNKYRIVVKERNERNSMLAWLALDSGLPVRMADENGKWSQEYHNIKLGEPDAALFELPGGYTKFSMGMGG